MAALTVIQKFFALALKLDMREITPWIMFRCAILRSTSLSGFVVLDIGACFSGVALRTAHQRHRPRKPLPASALR